MKKLILAIAIFLGASPLWAELMTYQGRLKESNIPVTGNRLFTFEFCDAEDGSGLCLVAPGTPANFAVVNGLFRSTITIPSSADLSVGAWYLRVTVGSSILTPLERLTAVPYSVFASSAGYAAYAAGAVLKAGDTMTGQLTVSGSTFTVIGPDGNANGGLMWVSTSAVTPALYVSTSGRVGVGTAAPGHPLHIVNNSGQVAMRVEGANATATSIYVESKSGGKPAHGYVRGGYLKAMTSVDASGSFQIEVGPDPRLTITPAGFTGIGTETPNYQLHVSSAAGEAGTIMAVSTGASNLFWVEGDGAHAARFYGDGSGLTGVTGATGTDPNALQLTGGTLTGPLHILSDDLANDTSDFITTGLVISTGGAIQTTGLGYGSAVGNARGKGAVDLQTYRSLPAQVASGIYSVLSGGFLNRAVGSYSSVGGGYTNSANTGYATVGGGLGNTASGLYSGVGGGQNNTASGQDSFVAGGNGNTASNTTSVVGGGQNHLVSGAQSGAFSGYYSDVSGNNSFAGGGYQNKVAGSYSAVLGGMENRVSGDYSAAGGGKYNVVSGSNSAVSGGGYNTVTGTSAVIAGGEYNAASGMYSSVGGGLSNTASNTYSYVGGGQANSASANHAVVAGGQSNAAISAQSAVAGGAGNRAEAQYAFVGGGNDNRATGMYATVPGGYNNTAKANYSFAAGGRSSSTAQGAFTWQDSGGAAINLVNDVADRTVFKNRGGFLVTGSTNTSMTGTLDRGVFITGNGLVGVSTGAPQAALDVVATGNTVSDYAQIWRDSSGVDRASVTATGVFYGNGSGLTGVIASDPNALPLAGGTLAGALNMNGNPLAGVSTINILNGIIAIVPAGTGGSNANYGVSIGSNSYNNYSSGVGLGRDSYDNHTYGVGVGAATYNNNTYGVGVGSNSTGNYDSGVGMGRDSYGNYDHGTGLGAGANENRVYGLGAGYNASANRNYGLGLGAFASGNDDYAVGVGAYSQNTGGYGAALGAYSYASSSATALGAQAKANAELSMALGYGTVNNSTGTASFGSYGVNAAYYQIGGSTVIAILPGIGSMGIGVNAGALETQSYNIYIGSGSGRNHTTGTNNTMLGYLSGQSNLGGSGNTFIGSFAGLDNVSGGHNIVIGYLQDTSAGNSSYEMNIGGLLFGNMNEKTVGISTRAPQAALDVVSTGTASNVYAQIWRDSTGLVVSSVNSQGVFYGNGSGLTGVTAAGAVQKAGDTMQGTLDMGGNFLAGVSTITMLNGSIAIVPPGTGGSNNNYGVSIGSNSYNNYNSGVGVGYNTYGNSSGGVGLGVSAYGNNNAGVGVGYGAANNNDYAVGLGAYAKDNAPYSTSVGAYSQNNKTYGAALGAYSYASSSAAALGAYAKANAELSLALGFGTVNNSTGTASFGGYGVNAAYYQVNGSTILAMLPGVASLGVGVEAGRVSTATQNTFVGVQAGYDNTAGAGNSFLGYRAGYANTTGAGNSFMGKSVAYSNTTGSNNTFLGFESALANTTGGNNSYLGHSAGYNNLTGSANAAFGSGAGRGISGQSYSSSTLVGYQAGYNLNASVGNILIGYKAGYTITTGTGNIVIGYDQDVYTPTDNNVLNIGGVLFGELQDKTIGINSFLPTTPVKPQAALDVISTGTAANVYAQIWRDSDGFVVSSVSAQGFFYGDGSGLRNVTAYGAVQRAGDNMTGQLTTASTITVRGDAFSVGDSTFVVKAGRVGINWITPEAALQVSGGAKFLSDAGTSYILTAGSSSRPDIFFVSSGGIVGMGDFTGVSVDTAAAVQIASRLTGASNGLEDTRMGLFVESHTDGSLDSSDLLVGANLEATLRGADAPSLVSALRLKVRRENSPTGNVDRAMGLFIDDLQNEAGGTINNTYGIFIGDQSSGSQNNDPYALFSVDPNARSYFAGSVGIARSVIEARLDVAAAGLGADSMGQIWRNFDGTIVSSVSATGVMMANRFVGDGSGLINVPGVQKTGDTMTGALRLPQGTDAVPSLSFSGDENTGLYSPGQDQFAFATAGTERLRVTDAGRVGIGVALPAEALDISGRVQISTNAGGNPVTDGLLSTGSGGMMFYSNGTKYMHVGANGNYIGIGPSASIQSDAQSPKVQVKGSMSVGSGYIASHPQADSLVVQARLGVGTPTPDAALSVVQSDVVASSYTVHIGTSASAYHLVVTTGGWVGLNTRQPQAPLHLTAATKDEGIVVEHNSETSEGSYLALVKARGTANSQTVVQSGDNLGVLAFGGYNAAPNDPFPTAAAIVGRVDGVASVSPGTDMPGRLEFMTASDGTTEMQTRMVIRNDGSVGISAGTPKAMLDIRSTATVAQIWRDAGGVARATMTASGVLYAVVDSAVQKTGDTMSGNLSINVNPAMYAADFNTTGIRISTAGSITTIGAGNGISGPGARGMGAVDLQTAREVSGHVALGDFSTLSGGAFNTVLGSNTVVAGGRYNIGAGTSAVISGGEGNYVASYFGTIGGGKGNSAYGSHSAIFSGSDNLAEEMFAFVGSGYGNTASTSYSVVAGGYNNVAGVSGGDGEGSFIGGGRNNTVNQNYGAIAGGMNNAVGDFADYAFIGGGYENDANGTHSAVAGGWWNVANGMDSFVGGGLGNVAAGSYSSVVGGSSNTAKGDYSFAAGYKSSSTAAGTFTWADSKGVVVENSVADQVMFKAAGGFWVSTGTAYADPALYVSNTNKVGIGTNAPGFKLHVKDLAGGAIAGLTSSPSSTDAGVYGWSNSAATAIKGVASSGYAGRFEGNVFITNDGVNPANPAKLQVNGDLGLGDGTQTGNAPVVIWLTASTPFVSGDVVIASGNNQFGTTVAASTPTVIGVAISAGTTAQVGKIAVAGVVVAKCIGGAFGQHAVTSATPGSVSGTGFPSSGTSVGIFLTDCGNPNVGQARLLLK